MIGLVINDQLRRAILLPEFEAIHGTASCSIWLLDTMDGRWKNLQYLNTKLREKQARI